MKKLIIIATVFIFMVLVGFSLAANKLLMDLGTFWHVSIGFAIILLGIYYIKLNRGENRAKEIAVTMLLIYFALFWDPMSCIMCYVFGMALYIYELVKWRENSKTDTNGCYCRWMVYNIMLLSFILGNNILFVMKNLTSPIPLILTTMIWLTMCVTLALRLKS